jgi:hypothetical protein
MGGHKGYAQVLVMNGGEMKFESSTRRINITEDIAAHCDRPDQFEKFDKLIRAIIATPKAQINENEAKWKRARAKKRAGE